jgi:hypothetical protein
MVVITLRVMIRHAERDGCYETSMVVITLRVMIRHAERDGYYVTMRIRRRACRSAFDTERAANGTVSLNRSGTQTVKGS